MHATTLGRARTVLALVLVANLGVAVAKVAAGLTTGSAAVRADGFHSLIDASANSFGLIALTLAVRPPDQTHAYGHRKFETFASLGIVMLLAVLVVEIVRDAVDRLRLGVEPEISGVAFGVMGATIAVNIAVTLLERRAGLVLHSDFLVADAHQTAADILISAGVIVGIALAAVGVPQADAAASLVVAAAVAVIGLQIARRSAEVLLDRSVIPDQDIDAIMGRIGGVRNWHKIRTRGRADEVFIDLHISVDPAISVQAGHGIAHDVQDGIRARFPAVADVTVHVEPDAARPPGASA